MVLPELNELVQILDKELNLYRDVFEISSNKSQIISDRKIPELENITKIEQSYILMASQLEKQREIVTDKIADILNVDKSHFSISRLIETLDNSQSSIFKNYHEEFKKLFANIKNVNELNSKLLKNSLEYVDFSINLVANTEPGNNNYGNSGQLNKSKKRNLFDVKL